ncbi:nitroreductase family deazaflavin-dependent oxidoreductase [Parahaliea aestuarii]|uniref:Nitroreductase family deazaflavin-dependent oxidoreductase n=1 Tax=Parahaliea aestuarii TaxID=1852021 RepID=A0A5C8ZPF3_9GAMM|nr:nitroreductase family deazaflavin-dependent oxidoreductase [Parahaliea aestuarii]TXS90105.1 nitroreductase family deazaflavin-dependent oxidoreductase [Parahaliea aestuarii]
MKQFDYVKTRREDVRPIPEKQVPLVRFFLKWATRVQVAGFRASKGRIMNTFPGGYPVCVVTTLGAKSGKPRRIALIHLPLGEDKLLVASQGGMPINPAWYYNVKANPELQIMVDGEEHTYVARQVSAGEKAELWPHLCSLYPDFDEYQARTDRDIPVFRCSRTDGH